ncbi:MAG: histidine kinase dimerization/phospho-acceptor domain-containing protein, partial [Clostridiales bacterium]|nr:histidine kinase dimerization/phospho-acceptor domain-containing protein [Clostridiales bacterium]
MKRLRQIRVNQNTFRQSGELVTILRNEMKANPFKSLKIVMFLSFFLLSFLIMAAFDIMLQKSYNDKTIEEKLTLVQNQCSILGNQILVNQFTIDSMQDNLNVEIDQLANVWEGRILVIDSAYRIVKDTYTIEQDNYIVYDEVIRVMRGEKDKNIRMLDDYAEIMIPIVNSDKVINGVMIATVSLKDIEGTNAYIASQANVLILLFSLLAIAAAFIISNLSVHDIKMLNQRIKELDDGDLDDLKVKSRYTELSSLIDSFNTLIDKMQVVEASRQEFVSNVSHELKTPITSMKVLADSLLMQEEVPVEMYREFMTDMVAEIDRENKIINDLLTLVKM